MKKAVSIMLVIAMMLSIGIVTPMSKETALAAEDMAEAVDLSTNFTKTFILGVSDTVQTVTMPVTFTRDVYSKVKVTFEGVTDTGFCMISKSPTISKEQADYVVLDMTDESNVINSSYTKDRFDDKGNLYLSFMKSKNDMNREVKVTIEVMTYENTTGGDIKAGQTVTSVKTNNSADSYYKFTLPSAGKVTVQSDHDLTLCSASRKEIMTFFDKKGYTTLILNKGTYYLKNRMIGTTTFRYTYKKIFLPGNQSKNKAKSVKPGQKVSGTLPINSKGCWYKCKIDKAKKFKFNYILSEDLNVTVVVYKNNKKIAVGEGISAKKGTLRFIKSGKSVSLDKGTYFIKVAPFGGLDYGKFTLTMK